MAISPTIATMEPHKLRLRLGLWLLTWFLSTQLLHRFSSLAFSLSFPKNTFPELLINLIGFWRTFVGIGKMGGAGVVSSWFLSVNTKNWYRKKTDLWAEFGKEMPFGRKISSEDSAEILAVGNTPSFGRRTVYA
jgi:hypothetical protein